MKKITKLLFGFAGAALLLASCEGVLEENPKTVFTPDYFSTPAGVEGGLTSLYSNMRGRYGGGMGFYQALLTGTDEVTYAKNGGQGNFMTTDMSGNGVVNADSSPMGGYWNFRSINTANGIIENAEKVGLSAALIAEAKFFRALDYFFMVRIFGGVPLDLGSGELKFNTTPVRTSVRNTVTEVYTKCIFPDLEDCVKNLPDVARRTGTLTKTAARILLSKAYLTYGWWLENPEDIPTYPACDRVDPNGKSAQQYFQMAYDMAKQGIDNPGQHGLESCYYNVFVGSNDRNKEQVLYADRTEESEYYSNANFSYASGSQDNTAFWAMQWNYPAMTAKNNEGVNVNPVLRSDDQSLGRPWTRIAPTHEGLAHFTDRDIDSRYDGTFTSIYRTNWKLDGKAYDYVEGPNGAQIGNNEPFLEFIPVDDPTVQYVQDAGEAVLGVSPNYDHYVITPSGVSRNSYPGIWKIGTYREKTTGLGQPNGAISRPFVILKFSELYFTAAEAAVKLGKNKEARDMVNVLRARAGKWEYKNNAQEVYVADFSEEMMAKTPETITIDWLLDEMSRENFGEGFRWLDLARTQTWHTRAAKYHISGMGKADHTPLEVTRTIEKFHYLQPIPVGQINGMKMSDEEKAAYQNPGY